MDVVPEGLTGTAAANVRSGRVRAPSAHATVALLIEVAADFAVIVGSPVWVLDSCEACC